jgi:hypothetical protein
VGIKNDLGKAFALTNGYSIIKVNNDEQIIFKPIKEACEPFHFVVAAIKIGNNHYFITAPKTEMAHKL